MPKNKSILVMGSVAFISIAAAAGTWYATHSANQRIERKVSTVLKEIDQTSGDVLDLSYGAVEGIATSRGVRITDPVVKYPLDGKDGDTGILSAESVRVTGARSDNGRVTRIAGITWKNLALKFPSGSVKADRITIGPIDVPKTDDASAKAFLPRIIDTLKVRNLVINSSKNGKKFRGKIKKISGSGIGVDMPGRVDSLEISGIAIESPERNKSVSIGEMTFDGVDVSALSELGNRPSQSDVAAAVRDVSDGKVRITNIHSTYGNRETFTRTVNVNVSGGKKAEIDVNVTDTKVLRKGETIFSLKSSHGRYSWSPAGGSLDIKMSTTMSDGNQGVETSVELDGLTYNALKKLETKQVPADLRFESFTFRISERDALKSFVEARAEAENIPVERFRARLRKMMRLMAPTPKIGRAVSHFIQRDGTLSVTMKPDDPVKLANVSPDKLMRNFDAFRKTFNLNVEFHAAN